MIGAVALKDLVTFDPQAPRTTLSVVDPLVAFMPMAAMSATESVAHARQTRPASELLNGYTYFQTDDVLVAKITPCFENGKIALAEIDGEHGFGTTEFHVLRAKRERLLPKYLTHFLRQPWVVAEGERKMTGSAGQRRVPKHFFQDLRIPLPSLQEQRRIAAILDQAEALRAKRRQALAKLDTLTGSYFNELFGADTKGSQFKTMRIDQVCELIVDCVNRTAPVLEQATPYKMVRTSNVKKGKVLLDSVRFVSEQTFLRWNRRATPTSGDVLLTREAPVGEVGMIETYDDLFLGQRLMLYRADRSLILPAYLSLCMQSSFVQNQLGKGSSGSTVKHLPLPVCRSFMVPVPPLELQTRFTEIEHHVRAQGAVYNSQGQILASLTTAFQHQAFEGTV